MTGCVKTLAHAPADRTDCSARGRGALPSELGVAAADVSPGASFVVDLGADSLTVVELNWAFEKAFGIEISDADAGKINTVGDAIRYLAARLGRSPLPA
jgi:acyl carrier protein